MTTQTMIATFIIAVMAGAAVGIRKPHHHRLISPHQTHRLHHHHDLHHGHPHHGHDIHHGHDSHHASDSHHKPLYTPYHPEYKPKHAKVSYKDAPKCAYNSSKPICLYDHDYPEYEIKQAIADNKYKFLELYADVADIDTLSSVYGLETLYDETYLCPSETGYIRPLRAINTNDKWRVIVNNVKVDYDVFTQTTRVEECTTADKYCPLVPTCNKSKCLQKSIVHRFLVYDPYDEYFPFAMETFELPASCACYVDESHYGKY